MKTVRDQLGASGYRSRGIIKIFLDDSPAREENVRASAMLDRNEQHVQSIRPEKYIRTYPRIEVSLLKIRTLRALCFLSFERPSPARFLSTTRIYITAKRK